ncbi:MAG: hypothetical protein KC619_00440 [Myxococcales bacterium]|nr:hypothetical protein [Myxococcales bacterium]
MPPPTPLESVFHHAASGWLVPVPAPHDLASAINSIDQDAIANEALRQEAMWLEARELLAREEHLYEERFKELAPLQQEQLLLMQQRAALVVGHQPATALEYQQLLGALDERLRQIGLVFHEVGKPVSDARSNAMEVLPTRDVLVGLHERVERMQRFLEHQQRSHGASYVPVAPTGENRHRPEARYFRMLVWNLENFTRDPRPRGSAPIASPRNQARIALVSSLAVKLGVDALLMMETGSDVGTAVTQIAQTIDAMAPTDERRATPLASAGTHPIPTLSQAYPGITCGPPTAGRVSALRVVSECYDVTPTYPIGAVTQRQLSDAFGLLSVVSSDVASLGLELDEGSFVDGGSSWFVSPALCFFVHQTLAPLEREAEAAEDVRLVLTGLEEMTQWQVQYANQWPDTAAVHVMAARDLADLCRLAGQRQLAGVAELAELTLLFGLQAGGATGKTPSQLRVHRAARHQPPTLPQLVYLLTGAQSLDLVCPDADLGPLGLASDTEVLYEATRRLGLTDFRSETYGIVYRCTPDLLQRFFHLPCIESGNPDAPVYQILQETAQGTLQAQVARAPLRGRSGLFLRFPATATVEVPVVLFHNRFTANEDIARRYDAFTAEENGIIARLETLSDLASHVVGEGPLIVGDFNTPRTYLEPEAEPAKAASKVSWARRGEIRQSHLQHMAALGYVRRTAGADPATSLVSVGALSEGLGPGSEPYDAVYQPFDFLHGTAAVTSAVVGDLGAFFDAETLALPLRVERVRLQDAPDVDIDASAAEEVVDPVPEAPTEAADTTVWGAACMELARAYRSVLRGVVRPLKAAIENASQAGRRLEQRPDLIEPLSNIGGALGAVEALCTTRAGELEMAVSANPDAVLAWAPPFEDLRGAALAVAGGLGRNGSAFVALAKAIEVAQVRAAGLEQHPDRRRWVIYRSVVSDHVPVLVELDLAPNG